MATFNTVWSLDVGRSSLKAVKVRRDRNSVEILAVDKIDYKPSDNGVDSAAKAKEAIAAFRARNDVKEPVIVAHHGQGTLSRFIKVPAFDDKKVKEMVGYEASQQIPFPLDEVIWDYHVIDRDYLPGEEREVGLFAARRETIDDYLLDFTSENLQVEGLTIGYLGLLNYVFYDLDPQEPSIILDIGGSHTDLILVDGKKFWLRTLPHSGNDINKAIMSRLKLGFAEAEKLKIDIAKNPQQAAKLFAAIIQPKLKELVNQIHQSIGFYRSQVGETQFQNLYLLGNASRIVGIKKFLEEHLQVKVHRVQSIQHLRLSRDVDVALLQENLPSFGTAFGTALQGVGAGACRVDLVPQEEKLEKEYNRKKWHVFIAIGILFVAALLAGFMVRGKVGDATEAVQQTDAALKPYNDIDSKIRRIVEENIDAQERALTEVGKLRDRPFQALVLLQRILAALPLSAHPVETITMGRDGSRDPAAIQRLTLESDKALAEKIFVPWIQIRKVEWPESSAAAGGGGGGGGAAREKPPTVLAYKVAIFAVVPEQGDQAASLALIQERLRLPLEKLLRETKQTLDPIVTVDAASYRPGLPRPARPEATSSRARSELENYADGPFFGAELSFYLRADEPPKPQAVAKDDKKKSSKDK